MQNQCNRIFQYKLINLHFINTPKIQMTNIQSTKAVLDNYQFRLDKPVYSKANYEVFEGNHKDSKLAVTIKILSYYSNAELLKYLRKLKQCKSENVIRIYQLAADNDKLVLVTQHVGYGSLATSLAKCRRLEQNDAISVIKILLNGYVDLLRVDCQWLGVLQDIQFTDSGIKLSWSNFTNFKSTQCITRVLQKISKRQQGINQSSILPNPKNKTIQQLIKISKQNASQISLNSHLKKKQKQVKKKGKNWFGFKQLSTKNEYMEQTIYLAVSAQHGLVKVKIYEKGIISKQLINLNKSKLNYTKVVDHYDQNNKTIIISQYSNDGNLQGYITKLKSGGVKLNEQQIQFFFFSLFEPIKQVQQSPVKSIGMLHIRNIYLQNNIPKIGEPIPINQKLIATLNQRQDVPDFYHPKFKKQPSTKNQAYDTYSLGVLLYKLMYTEYPIFPQGKVHIPSAPTYSKRLKTTLQILLNEGGTLKAVQAKIQVSEVVVNQVKQNKKQLQDQVDRLQFQMKKNISVESTKRSLVSGVQTAAQLQQKQSEKQQQQVPQIQQQDDLNCFSLCCHSLDQSPNQKALNKYISITTLQESPYKIYRICTKILLVVLFYIFLYYFFFLKSNIDVLSNQSKLSVYNVTIATVNYPIITSDSLVFETTYNRTNRNLASLLSLNCLIDNYSGGVSYSDMIVTNSSGWIFYLISCLFSFIIIVGLKGWQTYAYDIVKAIYNKDHGKYDYNISNYIIFNLLFANLVYGHYYFYNLIFTGQYSPCIGVNYWYGSTDSLLHDKNKFLMPYMLTYILQLVCTFISWILVWRTHEIKYNKIVNPIFFFGPVIVTQWVIIRIGAINEYFQPNALQNNYIIRDYLLNIQYVNILGTIPQLLWVGQLFIGFTVDLIYWCFLDKRRRILIHDSSMASLDQFIQ